MAKFIEIDGNYINVEQIVRVKKEQAHSSSCGYYTKHALILTNSDGWMHLNEEEYNRVVHLLKPFLLG